MAKDRKLPRLANNLISLIGLAIVAIAAMVMTFLYLMDLLAGESNPYVGIFLYMIMPIGLIIGLILIPVGMYREWRRWKKTGEISAAKWPLVDLNRRDHRNATFIFLVGGVAFLGITSIGAYQAYHFSESVTFCGTVCHVVMKPEYTAYQYSPHARVSCVECHVGAGADWYAKSKLSGAYQVYAVAADVFPRPIPTPITSLRPAQETCEQCHWPEKFFGGQQKDLDHYRYDEANSPWSISLLIKTGGGDPRTGKTSGIHWHMNIGSKVEYIARDSRRQDIPWVRMTDHQTGQVSIYQDESNPLTAEEIAAAEPRLMDCMDCHNRPSHIYRSPDFAIDQQIFTHRISRDLPEIKRAAVEAMDQEYETEEQALAEIAAYIDEFYRNEYPEVLDTASHLVVQAIKAVQEAFARSIFPEMKVRWSEYPDNIGHFDSPGCMRCHSESMVTEDGEIATRDCRACHIILAQGYGDRAAVSSSSDGLDFDHPEDIDGAWQEMGCYECHTGVQP